MTHNFLPHPTTSLNIPISTSTFLHPSGFLIVLHLAFSLPNTSTNKEIARLANTKQDSHWLENNSANMTTPLSKDSEEDLLQGFDPHSSNESIASSDSGDSPLSSNFGSSSSWLSDAAEDWDVTPLDKLTIFDVLDNLALPQRLEKINRTLNLKKHKEKVRAEYVKQKERVMRRTDKELYKLKLKYTKGLDELIIRWNDTAVSMTPER